MNDKTKKLVEGIDDCERPACDDIKSMFQKAAAVANKKSSGTTSTTTSGGAQPATAKNAPTMKECPAGSSELGRSTWTLMHSMAAWYPDQPSPEDQSQMTAFMTSLARFYPCTWCATDFQHNVALSPPATESRTQLCQWVCEQHNIVNAKKGQPIVSCDMKTLDDRWRKSDRPECKDSYLFHGPH